jgi:hypothetical protein
MFSYFGQLPVVSLCFSKLSIVQVNKSEAELIELMNVFVNFVDINV